MGYPDIGIIGNIIRSKLTLSRDLEFAEKFFIKH